MAETFASLAEAADLLKSGAVGVMPTDTVYGLVCLSEDQKAVQRLYELKLREQKPGTVVAANINQLVELGVKYHYLKAVEDYWPNAISIVVPFTDPAKSYLRQGLMSLAVRIPKGKEINELLKQTGPLMTTSANTPGDPPATNISKAKQYFGDQIDFYVDIGDLGGNKPSTLIKIVDDAVEVLREGTVKINENE